MASFTFAFGFPYMNARTLLAPVSTRLAAPVAPLVLGLSFTWAMLPGVAQGQALAATTPALPAPRQVVSLSAAATEELTQDLLIVTLQADKEGSQAAEVQAGLKQLMDSALQEARKAAQPPGLTVRTGSYSVQPRYNNQGKANGWQGQAQLVLEGTDTARIAQVAGRINQLNVVQVTYGLSRGLRESRESELTSQAIARFRQRAQQIAQDFGAKGFTLGEVSVSSTEPGFEGRPYLLQAMRAKAVMAADSPLPVEPGKGVLSVSINGQIVLLP
jgi:predicted secreted protein